MDTTEQAPAMNSHENLGEISRKYHAALESFRSLSDSLTGRAGLSPRVKGFEFQMLTLLIWGACVRVVQSGPHSIENRLKGTPHLYDAIAYVLDDLGESLRDAHYLNFCETRRVRRMLGKNDEVTPLEHGADYRIEGIVPNTPPEAAIFCDGLDRVMLCLRDLALAMRNPVPFERPSGCGTGAAEDVTIYEQDDMEHVRNMFPNIRASMAETLAKFIARRRQFFRSREAQRDQLAADFDRTDAEDDTVSILYPELSEFPKSEDSKNDDKASNDLIDKNDGALLEQRMSQFPPIPAAAQYGDFECPFCFRIVSAAPGMAAKAWERHILRDLRPYACLFPECAGSNVDFNLRQYLYGHHRKDHEQKWSCTFKCGETFGYGVGLLHHISHHHLPDKSPKQPNFVTVLGETAATDRCIGDCPMCGHKLDEWTWPNHVQHHLEELALLALPRLEGERPEYQTESEEEEFKSHTRAPEPAATQQSKSHCTMQ
ncbi:hypothetical protein AK830_g9511 [Neonectria ditissima]|uniref:C2H2-type domain-containing protein n=1 Tax=Neonectria ditissima TaxID=78410 RepID=A0A0P7B5K8_9HYPO|nr:hypothetical protein AK830_g9511 [Neonectria ditissima]